MGTLLEWQRDIIVNQKWVFGSWLLYYPSKMRVLGCSGDWERGANLFVGRVERGTFAPIGSQIK